MSVMCPKVIAKEKISEKDSLIKRRTDAAASRVKQQSRWHLYGSPLSRKEMT
jgi:hypothetical protein